jgi:hypothetical protein
LFERLSANPIRGPHQLLQQMFPRAVIWGDEDHSEGALGSDEGGFAFFVSAGKRSIRFAGSA